MEYETGPINIGKRSVWVRFHTQDDKPVKMIAQSRDGVFSDIEMSLEESSLAYAACVAHLSDIRQSEQDLLFGDFKVFLSETLERIPDKELKIEGIEEYRQAAKKLLEVLNG